MAGVGLTLLYLALFAWGSDGATGRSVSERRGDSSCLRSAYLWRRGKLPAGGADLYRVSGDGGGADYAAPALSFRAVYSAVLPHAGLYSQRLLYGGVKPRTEPSDSNLHSGA